MRKANNKEESVYKTALSAMVLMLFGTISLAIEPPSSSVSLLAGNYTTAISDSLFPIYSKEHQLVYTDLQLQAQTADAGMVSLGGGYRQSLNNNDVLGTYLFIDRARSADKAYFTILSPGIEKLTSTWSYRLNSYIPIGDKTKQIESGWADSMGNYSYVKFSGHDQYDRYAYVNEELSYGGDVVLGYHFQENPRWKAILSPYVYRAPESNAMMGASTQLEFYPNDSFAVYFGDGYDNKNHNRVFVGIRYVFGKRSNQSSSLTQLMHAAVIRNMNLATTDNGLATTTYTSYGDQDLIETSNIYFVNNSNSTMSTLSLSAIANDGTYEHPYTNLNTAIAAAPSNAKLWIPKTKRINRFASDITLKSGQSLVGRGANYIRPGRGKNRPVLKFINSDGIQIDSSNKIVGFKIKGSGYQSDHTDAAAITISDSGNSEDTAVIRRVKIGALNNVNGYQNGIYMKDGAKANIFRSKIISFIGSGLTSDDAAYSIHMTENNTLNIIKSTIITRANTDDNDGFGIYADRNAVLDVASSKFITSAYGDAMGIRLTDSITNIENSTFNAINFSTSKNAIGIELYNPIGTSKVTGNTIHATSPNLAAGVVYGGGNSGNLNVVDNTIAVNGDAYAIGVYDSQTLGNYSTVTGNTITAISDTSTGYAFGIYDLYNNVTPSNNTYDLTGGTTESIYNG